MTLELEIKEVLGDSDRLVISTELVFGDLLWGLSSSAEVMALDQAVLLNAVDSRRQLVVERIRGEIRYWVTSDRAPDALDPETDLGTLASVRDVGAFCREFVLGDGPLSACVTPRTSKRLKRDP